MANTIPDYLSVSEAAASTGRVEVTIRRLIAKPESGPYIKIIDGKIHIHSEYLFGKYPPVNVTNRASNMTNIGTNNVIADVSHPISSPFLNVSLGSTTLDDISANIEEPPKTQNVHNHVHNPIHAEEVQEVIRTKNQAINALTVQLERQSALIIELSRQNHDQNERLRETLLLLADSQQQLKELPGRKVEEQPKPEAMETMKVRPGVGRSEVLLIIAVVLVLVTLVAVLMVGLGR